MRSEKRMYWLLAANLVALPMLASPAFGFIFYMNLRGVLIFVLVAWATATLAAFALWPTLARRPLAVAYPLAFAAAFLPVVLAWGIALHTLYWRPGDGLSEVARWIEDAVALGGVFTAGYWLPASVLNCFLLRRGAS